MNSSPNHPNLRFLGEKTDQTRALLASNISEAASRFSVYKNALAKIGFRPEAITPQNAFDVLNELPILEVESFRILINESFLKSDHIVDIETSSGTTGPRKRRLLSTVDDKSETLFLASLFNVCGINSDDQVACVDTGPLTLMASFTKALNILGVVDAYCLSIEPDPSKTSNHINNLNPTVIVSVPSVLERIIPTLKRSSKLRALVYAGEPLNPQSRISLETNLRVEVFSYYGASETSALGMECLAHDGVHLFNNRNIFEVYKSSTGDDYELVVTTLHQHTLPLLRYPLKDIVSIKSGSCRCGMEHPRIDIKGRADETVSILGTKLSFAIISDAISQHVGPVPIKIALSNDENETLTISLPNSLIKKEKEIRNSILNETELGFLVGSRLLNLNLQFQDESCLNSRKRRIEDNRHN